MTWLNPVAFIGLLALAVPILVHLFGRPAARRQRFPSLRLLRFTQPSPATRSRPSDLLLLVLRCLTILAAVAALAQPRMSGTRAPARVIMIDTSASMLRLTSDGSSAVQQARSIAQRMLDSAGEGIIIETSRPGANVAGAASWLENHSGRRELVIVSDFQLGAVSDGNFAAVPAEIGTTMVRAAPSGSDARGDSLAGIMLEAQSTTTSATWSGNRPDTGLSVRILAPEADSVAVRASMLAVRALVPRRMAPRHRVTAVFPRYERRQALEAQTAPLDSAWQGDLLIALRRDEKIARYARHDPWFAPCELPGTSVADGFVASVARGSGAEPGLLVFLCVEPGTASATAVLAAIESAISPAPALEELEPTFEPDEVLRRWDRPAVEVTPRGQDQTSPDGRWLWFLALGLLLLEEWIRRRSPRASAAPSTEIRNERVA
jgi:aerotolerance regulator-like protein